MLKRSLRLSRRDLENFFRKRSYYFRGALITARARRSRGPISRFAFVASGTKNRAAHLRNLARRRMAEAVQAMLKDVLAGPDGAVGAGWDIVFFIKLPGRQVPSFEVIKKDIKNVLSKNIL